jgi:hypothetical protein
VGNALAYLLKVSAKRKRRFATLTPEVNGIKTFFFIILKKLNKLERLFLTNLSSLGLYFRERLKPTRVEHPSGAFLWGMLLALPPNNRPG